MSESRFIEIDGVHKSFPDRQGGTFVALGGIDLTIAENEFVSLVGRSGWPTSPAGLLGGGLLLISVFWLLYSFGQLFALVGTLPIWLGAWLPSILGLAVLSLFLFARNRLLRETR